MKSRPVLLHLLLLANLLLGGCTWPWPRPLRMPDPGLPTRIDIASDPESIQLLGAALYPLADAPGAPGSGREATESLYHELLACNAFATLTLEPIPPAGLLSRTEAIADARQKGHAVIILGRLLRFFQGSLYAPTQVEEQIEILQLDPGSVRTLWLARADESIAPRPSQDRILVKFEGTAAPNARDLLVRNAIRFCRMLLPSRSMRENSRSNSN